MAVVFAHAGGRAVPMRDADRRAPSLREGDAVGVVAPGFAVRKRAVASGIAVLRRMGYRPIEGPHLHDRHGYFAGRDEDRAADLEAMLRDPAIRGIWFARGGFGTARILDRIPWADVANERKVLVGYSDLTALFAAAARTRWTCLHGPVVSELGDPSRFDAASLRALLAGGSVEIRVGARAVLRSGRAEGPLAGGNLTVLAHLLGTPWFPDLSGRILFLEDIGESVYRVDRMLTQLRAAGVLARVSGVLLGSLGGAPSGRRFPPDRPLRDAIGETFLALGVPVVSGIVAGHRARSRTLPLGGRVRIDTRAGRVAFRVPSP